MAKPKLVAPSELEAPVAPARLSVRHLLSVDDLSDNDIELAMQAAGSFLEVARRPIKKVPALRGKTVATVFYESSTRTRISFELAAKRLSADTVGVSMGTSSVTKGESLKDTAKTLSAMKVDAIVLRHPSPGSAAQVARWTSVVVINGGDGAHQHPTQALLDLFTLRQRFPSVAGLRVVVVGDILNSRVARSTISLLVRAGAEVVAVGPPTLAPRELSVLGCRVSHNLDDELPSADVIYLLRMQFERQQAALVPSLAEYCRGYSITKHRLSLAKPGKVLMHPGPMNRGVEIAGDTADEPESLVLDQVENGLAVRMALLYLLLGGEDARLHP